MIEFRFVSFKENLIEYVLKDCKSLKTAVIFPSNKSRNLGVEYLQRGSAFIETDLYTMEDLQKLAVLSEKPLVQDAKRFLLFYTSIVPAIREKYNLTDYFSSVRFISQVLDLFNELNEEGINFEDVENKLVESCFFTDWQREFWADLLELRNGYFKTLQSSPFSDIIFNTSNYECVMSFFDIYDKIVFANQFYFTEREKEIIRRISGENKKVILYFQMPESLFDQDKLSFKDFGLKDLLASEDNIDLNISVFSVPNRFSMLYNSLKILSENQVKNIVDFDFYNNEWFNFLSNKKFSLPQSFSIVNTEIFDFFKLLHSVSDALVYVKEIGSYLLPLEKVYEAFNYINFRDYFCKSQDKESLNLRLQRVFRDLSLNNYLYFNEDVITRISDDEIKESMLKFNGLLTRLIKIEQMSDFIEMIDSSDGLIISEICSLQTLNSTDILEKFYESLSNIFAIEDFAIISDWKDIFTSRPVIRDILRFFIDYLKPAMVSFKTESQGDIHFNTLVDTRNLSFDKIMFFNLTEGVLPKAKSVDFLFNERQRQVIGLKTYDDVRLREKYYFFRCVLNCREAYMFCIDNEDENCEKSSFLEELLIYMPKHTKSVKCDDTGYLDFYSQMMDCVYDEVRNKKNDDKLSKLDFYLIPSDFKTDFIDENRIILNTYTFMEIIDDSMLWYIKSNLKFKDFVQVAGDRLNPRFAGILTHVFIERIYLKISKNKKSEIRFEDFVNALNDKNLDEIYYELLYGDFLLKFPHDFSGKYFHTILYPVIKYNLINFFKNTKIAEISKEAKMSMEFNIPKTLFLKTDTYEVYINGKPDLFIKDKNKHYIIDFKTGNVKKEQLTLYKWLLDSNAINNDNIEYELYFLSLLSYETSTEQKNTDKHLLSLRKILKERLELIFNYGYYYPKSISKRQAYASISRVNILKKDKPDIWSIYSQEEDSDES